VKLHRAFLLLGIDPVEYFNRLSQSGKSARIELSLQILEQCRKQLKILLANNHPDKGGDSRKYIALQNAFKFIEEQTQEFISKLEDQIKESEEKNKHQILINKS
jgi:hypothetical protein